MLQLERKEYYRVKDGQTLQDVAKAYNVSARVLAQENGLKSEIRAGQILRVPLQRSGNAYTAREGESKALLCGSEENYKNKNGDVLYPGMRVIL